MSDPLKQNTFYNHFPTPEYLTLSNSGIAISDDGVHFVQLRHSKFGKGLRLSHYEKVALPEGVVEAGFINEPNKLKEVLVDLRRRHNLKFTRSTLPEERAYMFTTTIDKVPMEGIRDAVAFIIEENVPVSLADSVFDFNILSISESEGKMVVAVSVLPSKTVDFYLQVFEEAGITPVSFDVESQAIARAVVPKGDRTTQLILNLGKKKTGFYVVEDEVVQFTTTLPYGLESASTHINDLKTEIKKIFAYWTAKNKTDAPERPIIKILVCGVASQDQKYLNELLGDAPTSYDFTNPWMNVTAQNERLPSDLVKDGLEYVSAVGLSIPHPHRSYV
jgi:Tfp pilus assembly PilM family ATPase